MLLSDLEMPGEGGYALLHRVRTLSAGFAMHLPKPVDPAELVAVVGALAGRSRPAV